MYVAVKTFGKFSGRIFSPLKRLIFASVTTLYFLFMKACERGNFDTTLQRHNAEKLETNIPSKGIARPQSQFPHSCVYERRLFCCRKVSGPVRTIPFLGKHKCDFHCSAVGIYCSKVLFVSQLGP